MKESRLFTPEIIAMKREILEDLYTGEMTVWETKTVTDPECGLERETMVIVCENEPCRVSRQNAPQPTNSRPKVYDEITQITCAPEIPIMPSSVLEITFNGRTEKYVRSASPRVYSSHQSFFVKTWSEENRNYA